MTSKIKVLDPITANQIAAGEVVERPSSVVKELVENSIDAGSTRIDVEIKDGGTSYIRVTDNGCGLLAADAVLAFERHATSKISGLEDLYEISSLGFRGEALPSIASVAKVELTSRTQDHLAGTRVHLEGGRVTRVEDTGTPVGTGIIVRNLFFNTPARRKHLKPTGTEAGLIGNVVSRFALAYPGIAFTFTQNGRVLLKTTGTGSMLDAVVSIQGVQTAKALLPVSSSGELFALEGFMGKPELARANRGNQILFVNGRYVRSKLISLAVEEAYHTYLSIGRFPLFILNLQIKPHLVDVNVHPTKMEVRFSEEAELRQFLVTQIKAVLTGQALIPGLPELSNGQLIRESYSRNVYLENRVILNKTVETQDTGQNTEQLIEIVDTGKLSNIPQDSTQQAFYPDSSQQALHNENLSGDTASFFSDLQVLGQVGSTYIIAASPDGLFIIDQHAAHERIQYEKFLNSTPGQAMAQNLLIPVSAELGPLEAETVIANILLFRDLGYTLEHFGGNAFLIRAVPQGLPQGEETQLFFDILDNLKSRNNYQVDKLSIREEFIIMHACKSAIKANQPLTKPAMEELLRQLGETDNPYTCPHGRPTIIQYTGNDLAKAFKRI
jgi:DNA mismatch repair protein MutL